MIARHTIKPRRNSRRSRRARHRRQEGVALLVIMIIIVVTTAAAAVSVRNTTAEAAAAGRERMSIQARYAAEAAMQSTLAWLDLVGNSGSFIGIWQSWAGLQPPEVAPYTGGHIIANNASRHMAARSLQAAQNLLLPNMQPVSSPNVTLPIPDPTGSFGPNMPYSMEPFVVDITDCFLAPAGISAGAQVNAGGSGLRPQQFYCTLTVRGRIYPDLAQGVGITWTLAGTDYVQERSGVSNDTRATILTPAILVPAN